MKKIFLLLAAMLMTIVAKAWNVGDYYDADGVPSIIVYVDATGEHGLRMGPRYFYTAEWYKEALEKEEERQNAQASLPNSKFAQKQVKKQMNSPQVEAILANLPEGVDKEEVLRQMQLASTPGGAEALMQQAQEQMLAMQEGASVETAELLKQGIAATEYDPHMAYKNALTFADMVKYRFRDYSDRKAKFIKQQFANLAPISTGSGFDNTSNILDYCRTNNFDAELYFPEYVYAKSLGDGWFIPGNDELELIANAIAGGMGEAYKMSRVEETQKIAKYSYWYNAQFFFPYLELRSSTMVKGTWANADNASKVGKVSSGTARQDYYSLFMLSDYFGQNRWYVFTSNYQAVICAPVCRF